MNTNHQTRTTPKATVESLDAKQSRIISKILAPAVKLWLRSQVQQVAHLEVKITGSDRQILAGNIPSISIAASEAVYQGLHLSQIQLFGTGIKINLAQLLRGQPLRLLEPFPVLGELSVQASDLNASLTSPLLNHALTELLLTLIPTNVGGQIVCHKIDINNNQLIVNATLGVNSSKPTPAVIRTGLQLVSPHELQLQQIQIHSEIFSMDLDNFNLDLGSEVEIQALSLSKNQLICHGHINVIPA